MQDGSSSHASLTKEQLALLKFMAYNEHSKRALMDFMEIKRPASFSAKLLDPLLNAEMVEMTMPEAPRSPQQKYRLTRLGKSVFAANTQLPVDPVA